jgi:hypothetical protein
LDGKARIACLSHSGREHVENTWVLVRGGKLFETHVHFVGILFGELRNGPDAKEFEVADHSGADGEEIAQGTVRGQRSFLISL